MEIIHQTAATVLGCIPENVQRVPGGRFAEFAQKSDALFDAVNDESMLASNNESFKVVTLRGGIGSECYIAVLSEAVPLTWLVQCLLHAVGIVKEKSPMEHQLESAIEHAAAAL